MDALGSVPAPTATSSQGVDQHQVDHHLQLARAARSAAAGRHRAADRRSAPRRPLPAAGACGAPGGRRRRSQIHHQLLTSVPAPRADIELLARNQDQVDHHLQLGPCGAPGSRRYSAELFEHVNSCPG
jgi:hypothetical protein